jgi:chromosome partitioning protein
LSHKLGFRIVEGLAERLIFREFYPRGLTAVDQLDKGVLGVRPTLSHLTAALEMQSLIHAVLRFPAAQADVPAQADAA